MSLQNTQKELLNLKVTYPVATSTSKDGAFKQEAQNNQKEVTHETQG
jgi:hypothetical protein